MESRIAWISGKEPHRLPCVNEEMQSKFLFLPNWPVLTERGAYAKDVSSSKRTFKERGHPSLMPGIFTLHCMHDICYGFDVMETQESPNTPFTILQTRFPDAPRVIIYDNACNLHDYCMNHDHGFFRNTSFFVDRFHWKNHTACADSYNLSLYPQYSAINSQINEQRNALLTRAKNQLSYMNPTNFSNHCKLMLYYCNKKSK